MDALRLQTEPLKPATMQMLMGARAPGMPISSGFLKRNGRTGALTLPAGDETVLDYVRNK